MSKQDVAQVDIAAAPLRFSQAERRRLRSLRADYQVSRDFIGASELAHLRFIRWLHRTGRITP